MSLNLKDERCPFIKMCEWDVSLKHYIEYCYCKYKECEHFKTLIDTSESEDYCPRDWLIDNIEEIKEILDNKESK